jgi:hypothetical protein
MWQGITTKRYLWILHYHGSQNIAKSMSFVLENKSAAIDTRSRTHHHQTLGLGSFGWHLEFLRNLMINQVVSTFDECLLKVENL